MKKKTRAIIIALAAVVLLGGLLAVLMLTSDKGDNGDKDKPKASTFTAQPSAAITAIHVENKSGSYNLDFEGGEGKLISYTNVADTTLYYPDESIKFEQPSFTTIANAVVNMTSVEVVSGAGQTDLALYQLAEPQAKVRVTFKNGELLEFWVGGKAPDKSNTYLYLPATGEVHTVATNYLNPYMYAKERFVAYDMFPTPPSGEVPLIKSVVLGGTSRAESPIVIESLGDDANETMISSGFVTTQPKRRDVRSSVMSKLQAGWWGVKGDAVAYMEQNEETLAATGLDNPQSTMTVNYEGGSVTLSIGNKTEEGYYVASTYNKAVFVAAEDIVPWVNYKPTDVYENMVLVPPISAISSIRLDFDGHSYQFALKINEDEAGNKSLLATYNGTELNSDIMKTFYTVILSAAGEEPIDEVPETASALTITYYYNDAARSPDVLEFRPINERKAALVVNGDADYSMRSKYADKIKADVQKLISGEVITTEW